jgi:hypothetical protein
MKPNPHQHRRRCGLAAAVVVVAFALISGLLGGAAAQAAIGRSPRSVAGSTRPTKSTQATPPKRAPTNRSPVPLLAFYYSWFDVGSWRRAKNDYPELGRYTSDNPAVMRQHIAWAQAAGIDGFIVSWKDTPTNDRRLSLLMEVARAQHFKLAMIYQGLDFQRRPLPISQVAADFRYFAATYAQDSVFLRLGGKPLTAWSGTWAYSHAEVARVVGPVRDSMLVLNTEKSLTGYQRIADVTDGDAYYWSSVNPSTNKNYGPKLDELARAIHARDQYWMAPFAPGFDARKVGGSRTVQRDSGQTLRTEYATAVSSSPDVLGLISWNEFSENSYVEPSERYGHLYLNVLADLRHAATAVPSAAVDSSDSGSAGATQPPQGLDRSPRILVWIAGFLAFFLGMAALRPLVRRHDEELGLLGDPVSRPALPPGDQQSLAGHDLSASLTPARWRHWPPDDATTDSSKTPSA